MTLHKLLDTSDGFNAKLEFFRDRRMLSRATIFCTRGHCANIDSCVHPPI